MGRPGSLCESVCGDRRSDLNRAWITSRDSDMTSWPRIMRQRDEHEQLEGVAGSIYYLS